MIRSVMSLSGGMDSTSLLLRLLAEGSKVTCLTYDYGQKHSIEIDRSKNNIEYLSEILIPGDLLFFGSSQKCTHVGLHIENGFYIHSSGVTNGHNGIEIDELFPQELGNIASFYRSQFRSAGRVISCYQSGKF